MYPILIMRDNSISKKKKAIADFKKKTLEYTELAKALIETIENADFEDILLPAIHETAVRLNSPNNEEEEADLINSISADFIFIELLTKCFSYYDTRDKRENILKEFKELEDRLLN